MRRESAARHRSRAAGSRRAGRLGRAASQGEQAEQTEAMMHHKLRKVESRRDAEVGALRSQIDKLYERLNGLGAGNARGRAQNYSEALKWRQER